MHLPAHKEEYITERAPFWQQGHNMSVHRVVFEPNELASLCSCKQVALGDARMLEETSLKSSHHGNTSVGPKGSDEDREEKQTCVDMNPQSGLYLQSSETCFPSRSSQLHDDLNEFSNEWSSIGDLSQDASFSLESCVKWVAVDVYWHPVCITDLYRLF